MTFDASAYEQTVSKVTSGVQAISSGIGPLRSNVAALTGVSPMLVHPAVIRWVVKALDEFLRWVQKVLIWLIELIEGILAPLMFFGWASNWRGSIKRAATDSQALMNGLPIARSGDPLWKGPGAEAYVKKVPAQVSAAQSLGEICDGAGQICMDLAIAGGLLYVAVATLVLTLTGGMATIGAEICSVLGIPAAPPTAIAVAAAGAALVTGIKGLYDYITTLTRKASDLRSKAENNANFPGPPVGSWPIAVTAGSKGTLDDGSVADGDADWSVPKR